MDHVSGSLVDTAGMLHSTGTVDWLVHKRTSKGLGRRVAEILGIHASFLYNSYFLEISKEPSHKDLSSMMAGSLSPALCSGSRSPMNQEDLASESGAPPAIFVS